MTVDIIRSYKTGLTKCGFSHKRGLTTVVTAAMMLTAVAIMGSAMVAWSNGNLKSYETTLTTSAANNTNKITESVSIENIVFCSGCGYNKNVINVTLTNTGTIGVKINQIQVNSTVINTYALGTALPVNILPQNSYTVAAKLSNQWKSKSLDTITVMTSRGSIYTTQAAPP